MIWWCPLRHNAVGCFVKTLLFDRGDFLLLFSSSFFFSIILLASLLLIFFIYSLLLSELRMMNVSTIRMWRFSRYLQRHPFVLSERKVSTKSSLQILFDTNREFKFKLSDNRQVCFQFVLYFFFVFYKVFGGHMSFFGATDTPVFDFWWRLFWGSKPEWVLPYSLFVEADVMYIPRDPCLVLHMPTSWQPACSRSLPHMHVQRWDLARIQISNRPDRRRMRYHCASDPATFMLYFMLPYFEALWLFAYGTSNNITMFKKCDISREDDVELWIECRRHSK